MKITLFGAAGDVTGSAYWVQTRTANILVDFGLFQGSRVNEFRNNKLPPVNIRKLDAVVLTHAHLDHSGRLPLLTKNGYSNPIYCTPATIEIVSLLLLDSVKIQTQDLARDNRKRQRKGLSLLAPVFTEEHVEKVLSLLTPIGYNVKTEVGPGLSVVAKEAGHILGSVSFEVMEEENHRTKTVLFSGDIGPHNMAILKDPDTFSSADLVFMESTYGDRDHKSLEETLNEGGAILLKAIEEKGKILVPSFAVGRTQQLLYYMARAIYSHEIPGIPIYLDSPMAIEATKIYNKHTELYDDEALALLRAGAIKGDFSQIRLSVTADDSKALNDVPGPCMIIAGAGMCNAGRILHHLRHNLFKPETHVLIVGYQGEGTLGFKLLTGAKKVRIFGEEIAVKAKIHTLGGLSAHAGQTDLLKWFGSVAKSKPKLVLSHGEDKGRKPLAELIRQKYGISPILPGYGQVLEL